MASFNLLLASRKLSWPTLCFWGHSRQESKKDGKLFLSSDWLSSSKSEKPQTCVCSFSTREDWRALPEGHPSDTNKQSPRERKALNFKGTLVCYVKWPNKPGLSKEWSSELLTHRMWQIPRGSYLFTNASISFHCEQIVCDLSKESRALSVFPTNPMLTHNIYTPVCPLINCNPSHRHSPTTYMTGICGWVCVGVNSPLRTISEWAL